MSSSLWVLGYVEVFQIKYKYTDALNYADMRLDFATYEEAVEFATSNQFEEFTINKIYRKAN